MTTVSQIMPEERHHFDSTCQEEAPFTVSIESALQRLIQESGASDQDTIHTLRHKWNQLGTEFSFEVEPALTLTDPYHKTVFFQILKTAESSGQTETAVYKKDIYENPVRRLSKLIKTYWHGLTRCIDETHLDQILQDSKTSSGTVHYLYVPHSDEEGYSYYSSVAQKLGDRLVVERLPENVTLEYVKSLENSHGLLSLALEKTDSGYKGVPFVVPGGRFNEMYGWDSYFILKGLIVDGEIALAKAMVDNFIYQIEHYGKILNANRSYYLTRSQPPFFTSMIREVLPHLEKSSATKAWLKKALKAAIKEYREVWMGPQKLTDTGLSRYFGSGTGPCPEVEEGHFDHIYATFAKQYSMNPKDFKEQYLNGSLQVSELDEFFVHDRAVRESGHDTTHRWDDQCADFAPVELNCLLYQIEIDIARLIGEEFDGDLDGETALNWREAAQQRKEKINTYFWNEEKGLFFDYNVVLNRQDDYESATTLFPLYAGHEDDPTTHLLSKERAKRLLENALPFLEMAGGIAATGKNAKRSTRQWDFPNGWAPHQMVIWKGCLQHGFTDVACRLIYRWLYTIAKNAKDHNGMIPEKFDVVRRSHDVFACEYGNVGTDFDYITQEGFGWVNASFQLGIAILQTKAPHLYTSLEDFILPEEVFVQVP